MTANAHDYKWLRPRRPRTFSQVACVALRKRDGDDCWFCGLYVATAEQSADHVLRKRDGGSDALTNLRLAHLLCNMARA